MRTQLCIILIFGISSIIGQSTFLKRISLNDKGQGGDQVILANDSIFVQGYYLNQFLSFGSFFFKIDKYGNIGRSKFIEDTQPSNRSIIRSDQGILLAGNYNNSPDKQKLYWLNDSLGIEKSTILHDSVSNYDVTFQVELTEFDNRYHISTSANKNNEKTLFDFIVNKQGILDTLLVLPIENAKTFREVFVNKKEEITYYYNRWSEGISEENGIITYKDGIFKNLWSTGDYISRRHVPKGLQMKDSTYIIVDINDSNSHLPTISKLDQNGELLWNSKWPHRTTSNREIRKIIECKNGDILGMGLITEYSYNPSVELCAWVFRMGKEGELLWERAYYELENGKASRGVVSDLKELEDGSFIGTGEIRSEDTFIDILLLRIDSLGCIEGLNCGKTVVLTSSSELLLEKAEIELYPNPTNNILTIKPNKVEIETFQVFDILGSVVIPKTKISSTAIDVNHLKTGSYFIVFYDKDLKRYNERFQKI